MTEEQERIEETKQIRIRIPVEALKHITKLNPTQPHKYDQIQRLIEYLIMKEILTKQPNIISYQTQNWIALVESKHVLMIRNQESILERNKNNPYIVEAQLNLLKTLRPLLHTKNAHAYLDDVMIKYGDETIWNKTPQIEVMTTQEREVEKLRAWMRQKG